LFDFEIINLIFIRIVGGSSGGEGCIIGGTGSIMGIGSDIGGSIRMV
jgi:Asp-tRNA(Asn)/Glu-tRNA(Gln) amidotransferase A subunit family amidase